MSKNEVKTLGADFDMDDLADLPSFKAFPTGAYVVQLEKGLERKKVGEHDAVEAVLTLVEVGEVEADALSEGEALPNPGDKCNILFILGNEIGQGKLKEFVKPIKEQLGASGFAAIQQASVGLKLLLVGKRTVNKDDPDKKFFNPVTVALA